MKFIVCRRYPLICKFVFVSLIHCVFLIYHFSTVRQYIAMYIAGKLHSQIFGACSFLPTYVPKSCLWDKFFNVKILCGVRFVQYQFHASRNMCAYVCVRACIYIGMFICSCLLALVRVCTVYVCAHACMHVCVCMIYINVHTVS